MCPCWCVSGGLKRIKLACCPYAGLDALCLEAGWQFGLLELDFLLWLGSSGFLPWIQQSHAGGLQIGRMLLWFWCALLWGFGCSMLLAWRQCLDVVLLVFSFLFGLVGACSPRLFNFYFVLHGGCPCSCLWDPIPFLGLASAGENVPLHSPFAFACNVLLATSLYRKLVLLFFILIYSYIWSKKIIMKL